MGACQEHPWIPGFYETITRRENSDGEQPTRKGEGGFGALGSGFKAQFQELHWAHKK